MGRVISATTKFGSFRTLERDVFLEKARTLVREADRLLDAGDCVGALESAYQAGLRIAGARIADANLHRRRSLPRDAWSRLALVDEDGARQARELSAYSQVRSRTLMGLECDLGPAQVKGLISLVSSILEEVDSALGYLGSAA